MLAARTPLTPAGSCGVYLQSPRAAVTVVAVVAAVMPPPAAVQSGGITTPFRPADQSVHEGHVGSIFVAPSFCRENLPAGCTVAPPATTAVHIPDGLAGPTATLELLPRTITENGGAGRCHDAAGTFRPRWDARRDHGAAGGGDVEGRLRR